MTMYYIYHVKGKKIGVARDLNKRVIIFQGYKKEECEVLDSSEDIFYISKKEEELQEKYGYKKDKVTYLELTKDYNAEKQRIKIYVTNHTITFPFTIDVLKTNLNNFIGTKFKTSLGEYRLDENTIPWILKNVKASFRDNHSTYVYTNAFANQNVPIDKLSKIKRKINERKNTL